MSEADIPAAEGHVAFTLRAQPVDAIGKKNETSSNSCHTVEQKIAVEDNHDAAGVHCASPCHSVLHDC